MQQKPSIKDEPIVTTLETHFGLQIRSLDFLTLGNDPNSYLYRIETASKNYLVKLRKGDFYRASLTIPYFLHRSGNTHIVPPSASRSGELSVQIEGYILSLYRWIEGQSGIDLTLTQLQQTQFGKIIRSIHEAQLSPELIQDVQKERFIAKGEVSTRSLLSELPEFSDPILQKAANFWRENSNEIQQITDRTAEIGQQLQMLDLRFVLCHADIHKANIIIDNHDYIHVIDWDGVILAPKERDLMFFAEIRRDHDHTNSILQAYGDPQVNQLALAYYRYEWIVQEFGDYGELLFLRDDLTEDMKQFALNELQQLFEPGDVIESAYLTDPDR